MTAARTMISATLTCAGIWLAPKNGITMIALPTRAATSAKPRK